jgi:LPS export ABC transporter permease LptG
VRILSRYFVARFFGLFVATLFASTLVIVIVEMLLNLDDMLKRQAGLAGALSYLFLRIPSYYLRDLVPIASFVAAFFSMGMGANWREITACKAGGISPHRIALPVLGAALALSIATLALNETLVIRSIQEWSHQQGGVKSIAFRRGAFWYQRGTSIYNVGSAEPENRLLRQVEVFELSPTGRILRRIQAPRVEIGADNRWRFDDATIREFDPLHVDQAPAVSREDQIWMEMSDSGESALLVANASTLSLQSLWGFIETQIERGEPVERLRAALHTRLSDPVTVLLFALLALPLGLRVEQAGSFSRPAFYGVAVVATFYALHNTGTTLANSGVAPAAVALWITPLVFTLGACWALYRVPR